MHLKKYGPPKEVPFPEPQWDMNQKDYIEREDTEAEKFKVLRMEARVARSNDVRHALYGDKIKPYKKKQSPFVTHTKQKSINNVRFQSVQATPPQMLTGDRTQTTRSGDIPELDVNQTIPQNQEFPTTTH